MVTKRVWLIMVALLVMPMTAAACGMGEKVAEGYENTEVKHAYQHWNQGDSSAVPFVFIDVRTPEEYAEGHVENAKLIPVQELVERINEVPKDKQVYVYCRSGKRSAQAATILAKAGYINIENVLGGITAWKDATYPVVK
ncbi:Rhodanese-related sulfurtransferase [Mariprofundus aestuarium]|uniref:Rhodanese-related sulfurtransferase n=1 Tax=Mariprofundus aestuarium TaxID=1921086 RepID=A0A2K8KZW4_MARES|nr:rhodanese-like domain-containing protein [Mariprofundus aestuarium]ATX79469.1 Rhodanese-related sulfurtransferase [Mariprofundus aestuarium]